MLIQIPAVLAGVTLDSVRALVAGAEWVDGNVTSGHQAALVKSNQQLPENSDAAQRAGQIILEALGQSPLFFAAALPLKVFPPLFNRYGVGDGFGTHVDNAIRLKRGTEFRLRSDLSATIFLNG